MIVGMAGEKMRKGCAAAAAILAAVSLAGCGQDSSAPATSSTIPRFKAPPPAKKGPSVEELTAGMASAPTLGKSSLPLDMKFELAERPKIGRMLEINLAFVPQISGGPATFQIADSDGLDAAQGDSPFELPSLEPGEVYRHTLHLTPNTDGVLLVNVTLAVKHDEVSDSKGFSIPIIVDR
jgi:hypothetical protein